MRTTFKVALAVLFAISLSPDAVGAVVITSGTGHSDPFTLIASLAGEEITITGTGHNSPFRGGDAGLGLFFPGDSLFRVDQASGSDLGGTAVVGARTFNLCGEPSV